jgi:hypothetical protein
MRQTSLTSGPFLSFPSGSLEANDFTDGVTAHIKIARARIGILKSLQDIGYVVRLAPVWTPVA